MPIDISELDNPNEAFYVNPKTGKAKGKYNQETGIYKLWKGDKHIMLFNPQDIYTVYAGGSKTVLGNIMLLICSVDFANMVMIHKGKRKYPANSEKALMEILGVSERTWKDLRKILFHKEHPILCKGMYGIGDKKFYRYYMNPLISIFYTGISIFCYRLFRDYLKESLSTTDFETLEYWASEYDNEDCYDPKAMIKLDINESKMIYENNLKTPKK